MRGRNGLATPNPRPHALPRGTGGGCLSRGRAGAAAASEAASFKALLQKHAETEARAERERAATAACYCRRPLGLLR